MAKAVPSMTARTSCLRWVERLKPRKTPRAKPSLMGWSSPERYGRNSKPSLLGMVGIQQIGNPVHGASACHHRAAHERQASNDVRKRQQAGIKMWFDCGHIDGSRRAQRKQSVLGR